MVLTGKERIIAALQAMAQNFNSKVPDTLLQMWLSLLKPYRVEEIETGVKRVILEYEYKTLPPFAVLRQAIEKSLSTYVDDSTLQAMAEAEWAALREQVRRIGVYRTPRLDNVTTACVVDLMGGWETMCNMTVGELPYRRRDFIELWLNSREKEAAMLTGGNAVLELAQSEKVKNGVGRLALQQPASAQPQ